MSGLGPTAPLVKLAQKTTIHEVHEGSLDSAVLMSEEGFALAAAESYVDCIGGAQG